MEPKLSVLLYSKYSSLSKKLLDMIQTSGVDFSKYALQSLCIDNNEIRKRIYANKQIDVTSVPCLLIIFPDGGIEKYDGAHAFEWVEGIIRQHTPVQTIPVQQPIPTPEPTRPTPEPARPTPEPVREEKRRRRHRQRIAKTPVPENRGVTSIDDLPSDEDDEFISDRYRSRKPVGRVRKDSGNYTDDENMFPSDARDLRSTSDINRPNDAKAKKSMDLMAKAKELARGRETVPPPPGHPAEREM